ncbi:acyltransferase [Patescibacteria group bacterium]|nr:acyltransferase [Patescibacteria group bacterium]MBU1613497.1 acyltransferase [Patescibacteria group bacterium]
MESLIRKILNYFFYRFFNFKKRIFTLLYRFSFADFGSNSVINDRIELRCPKNIFIGKKTVINYGCLLNAWGAKIRIGSFVHLSPEVMVNTGGLNLDDDFIRRRPLYKDVIIEDGVWLASRVVVNPGVRIGEGSVVGAGAVVTRDIPKYSFCAGVPARVIRSLK